MTALVPVTDFPVSEHVESFDKIAKAFDFFPRLQLCGGNTGLCKEGKIGINCYAFIASKDQFDDLGKSVIVIPLSLRFKAMRITDGNPVSFYNPKSPEFAQIQEESGKPDSGCMFGVEFLLWVPDKSRYATFFFNSKSSRPEAPNMRTLLGRGAFMESRIIKTAKFTWAVPTVKPYSTPIENLPDPEDAREQATKFVAAKDSEVEVAPESDRER